MKRISSLFAALLVAAIVAAGPVASAQNVHYIGAGSSAMFQGFGVAAVNDLAVAKILAGPTCNAASTDSCSVHHWSIKSSQAPTNLAGLVDSRQAGIPTEFGNIWVVWVDCVNGTTPNCPQNTGGNGATDIWAYLSVDSTVGVRNFLGRNAAGQPSSLTIGGAATTTAGTNVISQTLFSAPANVADDAGLQNDVFNALNNAPITAGMTDIRMEDALLATERLLGSVANPPNSCPPSDTGVPGAAAPICSNFPYFYSFSLGYGPGPIGTQIQSHYSGAKATPVAFALPGFSDPISQHAVPATIETIPVGESPILLIANRTNAAGLGQVIGNFPACGTPGTDTVVCTSTGAYTSDGSYYVRNMWDQHPYPPAANTFPSTTLPSVGFCANPANAGSATCHITRRPLGNLFAGNLCEGRNTAFSWPLDPALEGARTTIPNGVDFPVNLVLREPLSGTYNTFEFNEVRRFGSPQGNHTVNSSGLFGKPPYISQESNVQISAGAAYNPLNAACQPGFADTDTEGIRTRAIGTGEVISPAIKSNKDTIGYAFFSFGNVQTLSRSQSYGYLMIDGIDPLFGDYMNTAGNAGQPATPAAPLTWGELPACTPGGAPPVPDCRASAIWTATPSYPHLRDGSYPAWSEVRLMCDSASANCTTASDPLGAEALVQNLQFDIHNNNLGGVPDLLPFSDATSGGLSFNPPYGDAGFIRDHFKYLLADDNQEFNNGPGAPYINTTAQTTHQSIPAVGVNCSGGTPVNGPPTAECGGDVGGFVVPAGTANQGGQLQ